MTYINIFYTKKNLLSSILPILYKKRAVAKATAQKIYYIFLWY